MASLCNVQLRIISGHELPKTDLFSQIDPYVVVSFRGDVIGRTVTRDNNPNPLWEEDFFFEAEEDEEGLHGVVSLDLYDEEVTRDEYVGSITLDLATIGPDTLLQPVELPIVFKADKRGQKLAKSARRARLAIQIVGVGRGFSSYAADLAEVEQALVDEGTGTFLLPVPDTDGCVWAGMRFGSRWTQLLLVSTQDPKQAPNPALSYEWSFSGAPSLRVERLVYRRPVKMMGLKVWSESRAMNVSLDANLGKVRILERPQRLVDTLDPAEVLVAHNYMIGMPFLAAVKELSKRTTQVDTANQAIWIKMDSNQPQPAQLLQLDYSPDATSGVGIATGKTSSSSTSPERNGGSRPAPNGGGNGNKREPSKVPVLRICSTSSELNKGYELAFFGGGGRCSTGPMVSVSETYRRPVPVLDGMFDVVHTLELKDAFVGDTLEEVGLGCYEMVRPSRTWRFGKLLEAAMAGDMGEYAEGGAAGAAGGGYGDDGYGGGRGALGAVRGLFAWLSCMGRPRADAYLEGDGHGGRAESPPPRGKGRAGGGGAGAGAGRSQGGNERPRDTGRDRGGRQGYGEEETGGEGEEEDGDGGRTGHVRSKTGRGGAGGGGGLVSNGSVGDVGRGGSGSRGLAPQPSYRSTGRGGGGGGRDAPGSGFERNVSNSSGAGVARKKTASPGMGGGAGGRSGGGGVGGPRGGGSASVGSSSERSTSLPTYGSGQVGSRRKQAARGASRGRSSMDREEEEEEED